MTLPSKSGSSLDADGCACRAQRKNRTESSRCQRCCGWLTRSRIPPFETLARFSLRPHSSPTWIFKQQRPNVRGCIGCRWRGPTLASAGILTGTCSRGATLQIMKTGSTGDTATFPHAKVRDYSHSLELALPLSPSLSCSSLSGP